MLEAIKQIEAKGPPPSSGGMRPTPRRRTGDPAAPAGFSEPPTASIVDAPALEPSAFELPAEPPTVAATTATTLPLGMLGQPELTESAEHSGPAIRQTPADQVRRVAAAIMAHVPALSSGVVALAAGEPGLDTTPIVAALAEALVAGPRHEVLIVDARLDRGPARLAEYWGARPGLHDVLRRQATWHETIRPTAVRGLSMLEAGTAGDEPPAEQWHMLWSDLKRRFRFILVDGGAAMGTSPGWAATVDAVYLLIELERTPRWAAQQAVRHLQEAGARLAGTLLLDRQVRNPVL
jgi:Mrp family chromosome partitioning ATPase